MKKLLIGLMVLASFSAFSQTTTPDHAQMELSDVKVYFFGANTVGEYTTSYFKTGEVDLRNASNTQALITDILNEDKLRLVKSERQDVVQTLENFSSDFIKQEENLQSIISKFKFEDMKVLYYLDMANGNSRHCGVKISFKPETYLKKLHADSKQRLSETFSKHPHLIDVYSKGVKSEESIKSWWDALDYETSYGAHDSISSCASAAKDGYILDSSLLNAIQKVEKLMAKYSEELQTLENSILQDAKDFEVFVTGGTKLAHKNIDDSSRGNSKEDKSDEKEDKSTKSQTVNMQ